MRQASIVEGDWDEVRRAGSKDGRVEAIRLFVISEQQSKGSVLDHDGSEVKVSVDLDD